MDTFKDEILALKEDDCIHEHLTLKQIQAVLLLAEGMHTYSDIAKMIGVERNTLYCWRKNNPIFQDYLYEKLDEALTTIQEKHHIRLAESFDAIDEIKRKPKISKQDLDKAELHFKYIDKLHKSIDIITALNHVRQNRREC